MEGLHGVDVSWLHHSNKEHHQRTPSANGSRGPSPRPKDGPTPAPPQKASNSKPLPQPPRHPPPAHITPPSVSEPKQDVTNATSSPAANGPPKSQTAAKRPAIRGRTPSDKSVEDGSKASLRRPSWINNISSKFSSAQSTPTRSSQPPQQPLRSPPLPDASPAPAASNARVEEAEPAETSLTPKPKDSSSSFFSSLTRRLSTNAQSSGSSRVAGSGGICARKVLNVDPNRERCLVPELEVNKLRRVSFCVDVEIAGGPKYKDKVDEDDQDRKRKRKDVKLKERGEGEALKNPGALKEEKDKQGEPELEAKSKAQIGSSTETGPKGQLDGDTASVENDEEDITALPRDSMEDGPNGVNRKREKKRRSELERKERKEQKLRRAQECGMVPVEMGGDEDGEANGSTRSGDNGPYAPGDAPSSGTAPAANPQDPQRPTTDPVRIYRRCCQLRESPILKRITEQLMSPKCCVINEPGVVACLDLTNSRMQLPDVVTLGDWLAVVPVKRLLLEDADLNDEGVRVILAGLLAAKKPEPTKRKSPTPKHRGGLGPVAPYSERSGVIEKVTFKNNPRITRVGWKHISLFIYMCRSIKAIDLSMNAFPETLPASSRPSSMKTANEVQAHAVRDTDAAETLYKCLAERLGGSRLEELSVSECGLTAQHLRKVVDGAIMCGISRLGLAGNNIDDEGLEHIVRYLRSGVCHGVDLGGNDLRGKLGRIADSLIAKPGIPCWGLSLADCNLDAASLKPLFPALVRLSNFRFIDLSHNRELCAPNDSSTNTISLLRRYIGQMKDLKRIHLSNVGMSPKQAIALAEVLPEGPRLAHLSILQNPQLTALANATDESSQEEACALYASFLIAVRISKTLICIDVDVPSPESNEVVKALAKQVVAYSLRNMEQFAIAEATGDGNATANAAATLTAPHGGEKGIKSAKYPDVLLHLVGHVDGVPENHDNDDPAPDDDYIVGGTGVVKALQYVLGEKANDSRRTSVPGSPAGATPRDRPGSSAGFEEAGNAKAKQMSRNLLETARKIRSRLHPALMLEASTGDELAYRRLLYLDQTLESIIARFEEEYPETRVQVPGITDKMTSLAPSKQQPSDRPSTEQAVPTDLDLAGMEDDEEELSAVHAAMSRHNSDASLASRALTLEEGRLHRLGQHLRREVVASADGPVASPADDIRSAWSYNVKQERARLRALADKIESTPGETFRPLLEKHGWEGVLRDIGANYDDLRALQEQDPEAWGQFVDAQRKAKINIDRSRPGTPARPGA